MEVGGSNIQPRLIWLTRTDEMDRGAEPIAGVGAFVYLERVRLGPACRAEMCCAAWSGFLTSSGWPKAWSKMRPSWNSSWAEGDGRTRDTRGRGRRRWWSWSKSVVSLCCDELVVEGALQHSVSQRYLGAWVVSPEKLVVRGECHHVPGQLELSVRREGAARFHMQ